MLEVGKIYRRKHPRRYEGRVQEVEIVQKFQHYFLGSDCNHYDNMGRRAAGGRWREGYEYWDLVVQEFSLDLIEDIL